MASAAQQLQLEPLSLPTTNPGNGLLHCTPDPRVSRRFVEAPFLEAFKNRVDGALSSLLQWVASLPMEGLKLDGL